MGEEWAASSPFPYFVGERDPELDEAVRRGRLEEFAAFGWREDQIPDPVDPATRAAAVLRWGELDEPVHDEMLRWYRSLIRLRRAEADLADPTPGRASGRADAESLWLHRGAIDIVAHIGPDPASVEVPPAERTVLLANAEPGVERTAVHLPPDSVAILRRRQGASQCEA
jgi:maltooligosyltrehalose trehalohydrolase